ncbi:MAG: hypothetical protein ATN35_04985 [Epulopiscium sp. Nele67-Bin004]|nr:MAG: hypothetical protein ATN35_04985 [Epulopiscium sp. Nele67-Bin004]
MTDGTENALESPHLPRSFFHSLSLSLTYTQTNTHTYAFHTHAEEIYEDESWDDAGTNAGVILVANELERILEETYGIEVLHVVADFYENGSLVVTGGEYERMEPVIQQVIDDNPSIQIAIDIHRDSLGNPDLHLMTEIDGQETAKIMFVNGVCMRRDADNNLIPQQFLVSDYIEDNLAFSLQAQMAGLTYYPDMMRKIYLNQYRYSTHMLPYSLLLEVGADNNSVQEAINAMTPFAQILAQVFGWDN